MATGIEKDVAGADFGDVRLNARFLEIIDTFSSNPNLSIPSVTSSRAEMEAAYRFFDNSNVTPKKILQPHYDASIERVKNCKFALLVQDTTELDLTRPKSIVAGTGPMGSTSRRGAFFHPTIGYDLNGLPLGMVDSYWWTRKKIVTNLTSVEKKKERYKTPIEKKESYRWIQRLRNAYEIARKCPDTLCVSVCDSEADIYEMFSEPLLKRQSNLHLLVRSCQNRATVDGANCFQWVKAAKCRFKINVEIGARTARVSESVTRKRQSSRQARTVEMEVRAAKVVLRPPERRGRKLPEVPMNVVLVEECHPPKNTEPVQWVLTTTLPVNNNKQIRTIIKSYSLRWQIEVFFKTLKSGCRIEQRQFKTLPRVLNCLAVYSIVAWRILYLTQLSRLEPEISCESFLEPSEWKPLIAATKKGDLPKHPPSLKEVVRMIAMLGGYVDRKKTHPGAKTLWIGLQRMHMLSVAWDAFGPDSNFFDS